MLRKRENKSTDIAAVNDIDKLVDKCRTRQHQSTDKSNRQIEMFWLQASYTRCEQLLEQAELTVAAVMTQFHSTYQSDSQNTDQQQQSDLFIVMPGFMNSG